MKRSDLHTRISPSAKALLQKSAEERKLSLGRVIESLVKTLKPPLEIQDSPVKIQPAEVRKIRKDRRNGMSYRALALKYGHGLRTVHRACRGEGCYRKIRQHVSAGRSPRFTAEQIEILKQESLENSLSALSKKYKCSRTTLYKAIKGEGVYKNVA
jgi:DNA invertase Pin-like site-specific DNA recombinase